MNKLFIGFLILIILVIPSCYKNGSKRTLVIGDSNGSMPGNWVLQLHEMRPSDKFCNLSISGNTIGFVNNGQDTLNTLLNLGGYLARGEKELGEIERVIFLIGTNDCKAVFDSLQHEVPVNLEKLVSSTVEYFRNRRNIPEIILVSPPPIAADSTLAEKYKGGEERILKLIPAFRDVAEKHSMVFVNIHDSLKADFNELNTDGIHLNEKGYEKVAEIIDRELRKQDRFSILGMQPEK